MNEARLHAEARPHAEEFEPRAAGPAEYRVVTPPGWTGAEPLPLVLVLHGANSSAAGGRYGRLPPG